MSKVAADSDEGKQESDNDMTSNPAKSKTCLLCRAPGASAGPEGSVFIQPCRCGYWVHDKCLVSVILQFEYSNPETRSVGCKICKRAYNIYPAKSLFIIYAVKCCSSWYQAFCSYSMELLTELVGDVLFIKVGSFVFKKIYGPEEASRLISSMTPLAAIYACQLIPVVSIMICSIRWEDGILYVLRKGSYLPLVGRIFPMEDEEVKDIYREYSRSSLDTVGGLLLPLYAAGVSKLFTIWVAEPFQRFLLAGAAIVLIKGVCKMFYKQKKYMRYCTLSVLNSAPKER